jgi:dienelactone hydrolase
MTTAGSAAEATRGRVWRRLAIVAGFVASVLALAYAAIGLYGYTQLPRAVSAGCPATEGFVDIQEPTSFTAHTTKDGVRVDVDTTPYLMPAPTTVSFPARGEPGVTIAAWWEPVAAADAPTVVVAHGINGCRRNSGNLLVAGMLHRHGIAVLLIDMRNHGDSTVQDGRFWVGTHEYRDVLGAFDWLRGRGVPASRIGAFGFSGGAMASMIAIGEEPAIAAVWADSSNTDARAIYRDGAAGLGLPAFVGEAPLLATWILTGEDINARSPLAAIAKLNGRPIALSMGEKDDYLNPAYLAGLADAVRATGGSPVVWQAPGALHTQAHFLYPAEYEQRLMGFFGPALNG